MVKEPTDILQVVPESTEGKGALRDHTFSSDCENVEATSWYENKMKLAWGW
jgi:hypothetical protein